MFTIKMDNFIYEELEKKKELDLNNVIDYTWDQVSRYNYAKRKKDYEDEFNGDKKKQFYGLLTQNVIADWLGQSRSDGSSGFDNGRDLLINSSVVDIKTMIRTVNPLPGYTNNLLASQTAYDTQYYIFTSYNIKNNTITVCGIMPKPIILFFEKKLNVGDVVKNDIGKEIVIKRACYNINNEYLIDVNCFEDFYDIISNESYIEERNFHEISRKYNENKCQMSIY